MDIVALSSARLKMERLGECDCVFTTIDGQLTRDECLNSIVDSRLIILGLYVMFDRRKLTQFASNTLNPHELFTLEREH